VLGLAWAGQKAPAKTSSNARVEQRIYLGVGERERERERGRGKLKVKNNKRKRKKKVVEGKGS